MTNRLRNAIKLREWTRVALAKDDIMEVARLNREADAAHRLLTDSEAGVYCAWAFAESAVDRAMIILEPTP
jgi:MinD superfamily P-loop ATPase